MDLRYAVTGPLFQGTLGRDLDRAANEAEAEISEATAEAIRQQFDRVFKHPTGYARSRVQVQRESDRMQVNDSRLIYGPWLEGTGRRNRTTRFKGYRTFRLITQRMQSEGTRIADRIFTQVLRRYK